MSHPISSDTPSFKAEINNVAYAFGIPLCLGTLKQSAEDFCVTELLDIELSGEGEHVWLDIRKNNLSTERVAKTLARHAGVAYRDVGYAGMKDVRAVTRQWFSVWMPKQPDFDWSGFAMSGVEVLAVRRHSRKLKRGAHRGNQFEIRITDLNGDLVDLNRRIEQLKQHGAPNYFGPQRFGRDGDNLSKALALFSGEMRIKDRNLKSILLSAARSHVFNTLVCARVEEGSWCTLKSKEPAALNGGNAVFVSNGEPENERRLMQCDIHPTAPMWGRGALKATELYPDIHAWELAQLSGKEAFMHGLEKHGLDYVRRSIRSIPSDFNYAMVGADVVFRFALQSGQFATSIIRELVRTDG